MRKAILGFMMIMIGLSLVGLLVDCGGSQGKDKFDVIFDARPGLIRELRKNPALSRLPDDAFDFAMISQSSANPINDSTFILTSFVKYPNVYGRIEQTRFKCRVIYTQNYTHMKIVGFTTQ